MHKSLRIISRHALRKCSSIHKVLPAPFASPDEKSSRKSLHNNSACVSFFYSTLFLKYTKYSCELYALPNEKILRQSNHGGLNGVSVFCFFTDYFPLRLSLPLKGKHAMEGMFDIKIGGFRESRPTVLYEFCRNRRAGFPNPAAIYRKL